MRSGTSAMDVSELRVAAYTIPTDGPEADGTLSWSETTMVTVEATGGGVTGLGWTYGPAAAAHVIREQFAPIVTGQCLLDIPRINEAMCRATRNAGRPGICSLAVSAVDNALWDLKARVLEIPLHQLLGTARDEVPVYGSGGFTTYDEERTRRQLTHWVAECAIPRVKIKIGESWGSDEERDLARLRLAREVIGPDTELYADANGGYSVKQAIRVATRAADLDLRWFEEPVSSDDLPGLRTVADAVAPEVTAGEYGFDLPYFARMIPAVDCVQADITRCGGFTEFLRIGGLARAYGRQVSAHCAPSQHIAAMAALPNARHLEWFHDHVRLEQMFVEGAFTAKGGVVRPHADTAGTGLSLKHQDLEPFRVV